MENIKIVRHKTFLLLEIIIRSVVINKQLFLNQERHLDGINVSLSWKVKGYHFYTDSQPLVKPKNSTYIYEAIFDHQFNVYLNSNRNG